MGSQGLARPIVSICNNYGAKPGLTVTDQDKRSAPSANISICNSYSAKPVPDVTDRDEIKYRTDKPKPRPSCIFTDITYNVARAMWRAARLLMRRPPRAINSNHVYRFENKQRRYRGSKNTVLGPLQRLPPVRRPQASRNRSNAHQRQLLPRQHPAGKVFFQPFLSDSLCRPSRA